MQHSLADGKSQFCQSKRAFTLSAPLIAKSMHFSVRPLGEGVSVMSLNCTTLRGYA